MKETQDPPLPEGACEFPFGVNRRDYVAEWKKSKGKRRRSAREFRRSLIQVLGGRCILCGRSRRLEFHHPHGRDWTANRMNQMQRLRMYWRDYHLGNLELLCKKCNQGIGKPKDSAEAQGIKGYRLCGRRR